MGTLTNCTLLPLNSEFRFKPVHCSFRNKIHYNHRFNSHVSKWGKLKHVHFDRFKCFSINNKDGVDDEGENGNKNDSKSNVTTVLPDEDRGFNPDKSTTPSTSQRVHFCLILVFFCCLVASVVLTCYYLLIANIDSLIYGSYWINNLFAAYSTSTYHDKCLCISYFYNEV